jgi:hypothetical protein
MKSGERLFDAYIGINVSAEWLNLAVEKKKKHWPPETLDIFSPSDP